MTERILILSAFFFLGLGSSSQAAEAKKPRKISIKTIEGLRFDPVRLSVKPGELLELTIENHDPNDQPHNFVLSQIGSLQEIQSASMTISPDAVANGFIPDSDAILVHSKLLNPEEKDTLTFKAPDKKGVYPYICTFPGHALVMYGALYVDTRIKEDLAYDPHVPELVRSMELEKKKALLEVERPSLQRLFMPDAGPAAIAVALPHQLNYCWDAGNCRLRYAWSGAFVDATKMWNSNGNALAHILGERFWQSESGETVFGIQIGDAPTESVKFRGHDLVDGLPSFSYDVDGIAVRESIHATPQGLRWTFLIDLPTGDVRVLAPESDTATLSSTAGRRVENFWVVPREDAAEFTLLLAPK